jgi:gamma-glutamylcyclotransferase (GGCT)/AIG2-like uncharacterized protein YtfP
MVPTSEMSTQPRPLFIYGTLCAIPFLAWALTGDASNIEMVSSLVRPAKVKGYSRFSVHHADYPAVIKDKAEASIDGLLLTPETMTQRRKLDDFEGETYKITSVIATFFDAKGKLEMIEADMYIWDGEKEKLTMEPWDLETFIKERLEDWLELFGGMELIGGADDEP